MKRLTSITFALCVVFTSNLVVTQDAQETRADLYRRCDTAIQKTPQDAYEACREFLEKFPSDNTNNPRVELVKRWTANYEKSLPYIEYLKGLENDNPKATWYLYEPDMDVDLPQTSEKEGNYKIQISRSFKDSREEAMIKKAEAVYSSPASMLDKVFRLLPYSDEPPKEMAPPWGSRGNDNIQSTEVVTASAVRYYYDLTQTARQNPHLQTGFDALYTNLKYDAVVKHFDQYSHNKDSFKDAYVVDLTLEWGFTCGGLCGMGFTRNKVVVLDNKGNVLAMYLDAPVNSQSWVS